MTKVSGAPDSRRTDAELDEVARKFESEYGPADFKPRRGGRPALGEDNPSPRIQVRVPRQLYRSVSKRAHDQGTTISALVRQLLEKYAS
jgi:hypothetical protein